MNPLLIRQTLALFKFDGNWVKLHFDGETIFWRESEEPNEPVNRSLSTCLSLLNLYEFEGVVGHKLHSIEYDSDEEHVSVKLQYSHGKILLFKHHGYDDYATINCSQAHQI